MDGYYYKGLERAEKTAYEQMKTGLEALAPSIRVVRLESERLAEVYLRLKLDTPLLFYVVGYSYRYYPGADHVELIPEYLFEKSKIRTHQQAISARMQRHGSPSQIPLQSSVSRFPRPGPSSQLWQGSTVPSGARAMLDRHAPQLGIRCRPMSRRASSGSQPGLVKSSSISRLWAVSTAVRRISSSSLSERRVARLSPVVAAPEGMRPEQVAYRTPREAAKRRVSARSRFRLHSGVLMDTMSPAATAFLMPATVSPKP